VRSARYRAAMHQGGTARQHVTVTFALLALAGAAFSLLQSLVAPALTTIEEDLGTTATAGAWILTAYLVSASVSTPIAGRLGDMFGKKRTLVVVLVVLAAGTLVSALATSIGVMIAGRVIQGLGGAVFPLSFAIIRDEFPRERVPVAIALMSAILGIGGGLGIVLAGPIVDNLGYHWLFWIPFLVVVVAAVGAYVAIPESPIRTPGRINWTGSVLLAGWLVALLVAVTEGESWGWTSPKTVGLFLLAAVLAGAWVITESRSSEPLVDMRMMRLRGVWTTNLATFLFGFGMLGSFVLIPALVQMPPASGVGFGASVTQAGLFLAPTTLAMLIVSPIGGKLSARSGSRLPLILGSAVSAASFLWLGLEHSERWQVYLGSLLLGAGIGLAFAAMANLIVEAVRPEQTGVATGMNTIMRTIGGAIGAQLTATILVAYAAPSGLPTDQGFTIALLVAAGGLVLALGAALLVPKRRPAAVPAGRLAAAEGAVSNAPEA
jgi:EmrB/QacA subfamily drug resistance transporter